MGRKHYGKRRNCSLKAISPFPTACSKDLHCKQYKQGLVCKMVKTVKEMTFIKVVHKSRKQLFGISRTRNTSKAFTIPCLEKLYYFYLPTDILDVSELKVPADDQ